MRWATIGLVVLAGSLLFGQGMKQGLPPGIVLDSAGQLKGIPRATGSYQFDAQVKDQDQHTASRTFSLTINGGSSNLQIVTPAQLPAGIQNTPYSQTLQATGGTGTLTWSVVSSPAVTTPKPAAPPMKKPIVLPRGSAGG